MKPKKSRDHNDHNHYADDVKNIHCFAPIGIEGLGGFETQLKLCGSTPVRREFFPDRFFGALHSDMRAKGVGYKIKGRRANRVEQGYC